MELLGDPLELGVRRQAGLGESRAPQREPVGGGRPRDTHRNDRSLAAASGRCTDDQRRPDLVENVVRCSRGTFAGLREGNVDRELADHRLAVQQPQQLFALWAALRQPFQRESAELQPGLLRDCAREGRLARPRSADEVEDRPGRAEPGAAEPSRQPVDQRFV